MPLRHIEESLTASTYIIFLPLPRHHLGCRLGVHLSFQPLHHVAGAWVWLLRDTLYRNTQVKWLMLVMGYTNAYMDTHTDTHGPNFARISAWGVLGISHDRYYIDTPFESIYLRYPEFTTSRRHISPFPAWFLFLSNSDILIATTSVTDVMPT